MDAISNIPGWAEATLGKMPAHDQYEFGLLREFYQAFEELQEIPPDKLHRTQRKEASLKLVEKAIMLRRLKNPRYGRPGTLMLNGVSVE